MQRFSLFLTDQQRKALIALAKRTGLKFSELIRRAIDEFIARQNKK